MTRLIIKTTSELTPEELKRRYAKNAKDLANMKTPNKRIGVFLDRWVQENFRTEGGKVGGWKPLAAGGRMTNKGFDPTAKILRDTTALQHSFLPFATKRNAGIGSDLEYSKQHNEGLNGLPQRRILPQRSEVRKDIKKLYTQWVNEVMK